jgi:hypothetical protein
MNICKYCSSNNTDIKVLTEQLKLYVETTTYLKCLDCKVVDNMIKGIDIKNKPKKDNDRTIGIISLILIIAFIAYIVWTIIDAYAYAESDFVLEMSNANTIKDNERLTLFAIEGQSYRGGICPSGQCNLAWKIDPLLQSSNCR